MSDAISTALDKFAEAGAKAWTGVEPRSLRGELVWSKERPKVAGWYWCRSPYWMIVREWETPADAPSNFEWAGPINPPAEPSQS